MEVTKRYKKYQNEFYFRKKIQIRKQFIVYNDENYKYEIVIVLINN